MREILIFSHYKSRVNIKKSKSSSRIRECDNDFNVFKDVRRV